MVPLVLGVLRRSLGRMSLKAIVQACGFRGSPATRASLAMATAPGPPDSCRFVGKDLATCMAMMGLCRLVFRPPTPTHNPPRPARCLPQQPLLAPATPQLLRRALPQALQLPRLPPAQAPQLRVLLARLPPSQAPPLPAAQLLLVLRPEAQVLLPLLLLQMRLLLLQLGLPQMLRQGTRTSGRLDVSCPRPHPSRWPRAC